MRQVIRQIKLTLPALLALCALLVHSASIRAEETPLDAPAGVIDGAGAIEELLSRWGGDPARDVEIVSALQQASDVQLEALLQAESYAEVIAILRGRVALAGTEALGDSDVDYTFTPVTPCRIVDTRNAGGIMTPGSTRSFYVHGTVSTQGGETAGCASPVGEPRGVMINITAAPESNGHFRAYAADVSTPNASVLNYRSGVNIANAAALKTAYLAGTDIEVYSSGTSHLIMDVLGYYASPEKTQPDQYVLYASQTLASGEFAHVYSPPCPSGWRLSGGGFKWGSYPGILMIGMHPVMGESPVNVSGLNAADRYLCSGKNESIGGRILDCFATCTRVPGR